MPTEWCPARGDPLTRKAQIHHVPAVPGQADTLAVLRRRVIRCPPVYSEHAKQSRQTQHRISFEPPRPTRTLRSLSPPRRLSIPDARRSAAETENESTSDIAGLFRSDSGSCVTVVISPVPCMCRFKGGQEVASLHTDNKKAAVHSHHRACFSH